MLAAALSQLTKLTLTARLSHIPGAVSHIESQCLSTVNSFGLMVYLNTH